MCVQQLSRADAAAVLGLMRREMQVIALTGQPDTCIHVSNLCTREKDPRSQISSTPIHTIVPSQLLSERFTHRWRAAARTNMNSRDKEIDCGTRSDTLDVRRDSSLVIFEAWNRVRVTECT